MTEPREYVYALLRAAADWDRVVTGDPSVWSYDRAGRLEVDAVTLAQRADPQVWTEAGWDTPPRAYPALAVRVLNPAPAQELAPEAPSEPARPRRSRHRGRKRGTRTGVVLSQVRVPIELPEQLDCLCEAYRMAPGQVITRLVQEAYRRDVVESGLLAILGARDDIIAPTP